MIKAKKKKVRGTTVKRVKKKPSAMGGRAVSFLDQQEPAAKDESEEPSQLLIVNKVAE